MTRRSLGNTAIRVSPLVLGTNVFGWTADRERSFELLDRFVEAGLEALDTADVYSTWVPGNQGGESETIIGEGLRARGGRDRIVLITKVGMEMTPDRTQYNLYDRAAYESGLRELAVAEGLGVITYYSLASGLLTPVFRATRPDSAAGSPAAP